MHRTATPQPERIRRVLAHLRDGTTDEGDATIGFTAREYVDPGIARRERERVFTRVPVVVAHPAELTSTTTVQLAVRPLTLRAEPDGSVTGWTGPERTPMPVQVRHGLVWAVDDPDGTIDVAGWLGAADGEMDRVLGEYRMDRLELFRSATFDEPANWKLMQDGFVDNYHIQYAHPNTAGRMVHTNVQVVEDLGRHARMLAPRKSIDRWIHQDPGDTDLAPHVIDGHFLLPNSTLLRQPDHFQLLTFHPHPSDPGRCRMEMRLLVPSSGDAGLDPERWRARWEKNWSILIAVLHDEDFPLLRGSQRALTSADAAPMLLGRNELVNHIFRRELTRLLAD